MWFTSIGIGVGVLEVGVNVALALVLVLVQRLLLLQAIPCTKSYILYM